LRDKAAIVSHESMKTTVHFMLFLNRNFRLFFTLISNTWLIFRCPTMHCEYLSAAMKGMI